MTQAIKYKYLNSFDPLKNEMVQVLDSTGKIINSELIPDISDDKLLIAYKIMNLSRRQDDYQNKQQRLGRLLSFLSSTGQEACEVAYAMNLIDGKDYFLSGYRNNAAWLTIGMPMSNIMLYWMGNERGCIAPESVNSLPPNIVIGTQFSHATGIAWAEKYLKKEGVVLTTTGDGGSSQGEVYEALNFAKLHECPVVFVIENNQYAISTPRKKATKAINFAVKAVAAGMPSIKVDGNDFLACYGVFNEVIEWVRKGNGPILVECETYRLGAHSSSDNPKIYRPEAEFETAKLRDPLIRMKTFLTQRGLWDEQQQIELDSEQDKIIDEAFKMAEKNKNYPLEEIFDYMYAEKTADLIEQQTEAKAFYNKYPELVGGSH